MSSEWCSLTVGDLVHSGEASVQTGPFGSQLHSHDYVDNGVAVIPTEAIGRGRILDVSVPKVTTEKAEELSRHKLSIGDILFARRGAQATGLSAIVDTRYEGALCGTGALLLRVRSKRVDPNFLAVYLSSEESYSWLRTHAVGAVMPNINTDIIKALPIRLPDIEEQRSLAKFLGTLDERIILLRDTNTTLEAIAQALFKSWFVDFDPVRAKMEGRAPEGMDEATAALFPDSFDETELGAVPRGWSFSKLSNVCSYLNRGISPKYLDEGGVLVLNQKCVRDFSVDYAKGRRHDPIQRKVDGRYLALGDMLVNSTGVGTLGRVAQIIDLPEPAIVDSHVTVVRADQKLSWPYLGQWMTRKQPEIEAMGEGSTGQTELSRVKLGELMVLVPTSSLLAAFDSLVEPLKQRVSLNERKCQTLATLRDTLLPRLISGQLRLPEAQTLMEAVT